MRFLGIGALMIYLLFSSHEGNSQSQSDSSTTIQLNRVIIIGNKRTKDWIILRELTLKEGDTTTRTELEKILDLDRKKIYNLRIFHTATIKALELPGERFDLLVEVEERWFTFPIPIFELSDRNFNEWWENYDHKLNRTNYGVRLYQYNFRGRNETIRLTTRFGFSRKFDLIYRIPYIDKKRKQGLIFELDYAEPKNLAYKTVDHKLVFLSDQKTLSKSFLASVTYTYRNSFYDTHGLTFEYEHGSIADTIQILQASPDSPPPSYYYAGKSSQWFTTLAYYFISEHRDVVAYPLNGYNFTAELRKIGLGFGEDVNRTTVFASFAYHKDIGRDFFFSNNISGYFSTPDSQPYSLYFGHGYKRQFVRGYEIYVIEGPWYTLNKSTLKKRLFNQTFRLDVLPWERFQHLPIALYLKAHADFGYVENYPYYEANNQNTQLSDKLVAGAGLGLDLVTSYDGVLRVEYTFNRLGHHGFFFHIKKEF